MSSEQSDPSPPRATRCAAEIVLDNRTGSHFKFTVEHEYTGWPIDKKEDIYYKPDEKKTFFDNVEYNTGAFTTGVDNWKVSGIELNEETTTVNGKETTKLVEGTKFHSGSGALASWKKHTLRFEDDGKKTEIRVFPTEIHFVSPSGTSTTSFTK
ncbi:hypothetical protein B9Z55_002913 [Caenorhabditis nigoni]|uniref:Up-regulated in Daf-2 domain-containing protein n=1 Tax=Caenorhabditis nigoni TaxID=1611254 RepID=A0A2G5VMP3_9PELO|nr:hypothetical protein B9Z55_002913 [Caenorhabditis nigoni]